MAVFHVPIMFGKRSRQDLEILREAIRVFMGDNAMIERESPHLASEAGLREALEDAALASKRLARFLSTAPTVKPIPGLEKSQQEKALDALRFARATLDHAVVEVGRELVRRNGP